MGLMLQKHSYSVEKGLILASQPRLKEFGLAGIVTGRERRFAGARPEPRRAFLETAALRAIRHAYEGRFPGG